MVIVDGNDERDGNNYDEGIVIMVMLIVVMTVMTAIMYAVLIPHSRLV